MISSRDTAPETNTLQTLNQYSYIEWEPISKPVDNVITDWDFSIAGVAGTSLFSISKRAKESKVTVTYELMELGVDAKTTQISFNKLENIPSFSYVTDFPSFMSNLTKRPSVFSSDQVICVSDNIDKAYRSYAFTMHNKKWTKVPYSVDGLMPVSADMLFAKGAQHDKPGIFMQAAIECDYPEFFHENFISIFSTKFRKLSDTAAVSISNWNDIIYYSQFSNDNDGAKNTSERIYPSSNSIGSKRFLNNLTPLDDNGFFFTEDYKLSDTDNEIFSVNFFDITQKKCQSIHFGKTTKLFLSPNKSSLLHYEDLNRNGFTLINTKDFSKYYYELPHGISPVGFLPDERLVCQGNNKVQILNLAIQHQKIQAGISSIEHLMFFKELITLIISYCGELILPKTPDYTFSSLAFFKGASVTESEKESDPLKNDHHKTSVLASNL